MQLLKIILGLWLTLNFYSCAVKTVHVRYEGRLVERYQVLRKSNLRHGLYQIYHENGHLALEHEYNNGVLNGIERVFHEDGSLAGELPLKNGDYNGHFVYYFPEGGVKQRGYYKNDMLLGEVCSYYKNGQIERCVSVKDNLEQGPFREYSSEGILTRTGNYITLSGEEKGVEDGLIYEYDAETRRLITKIRCQEGFCCPFWERDKGYLKPMTSICDEIMNSK